MDTETGKRAAIYCRISSDPTGEAAGVERQRAECETFAEQLGLEVVEVFTDNDKSAYSGRPRPEFERLIGSAQAGDFDHLVVWHSDRLYRVMSDLVKITKTLAPFCKIHAKEGGDVDLESADGLLKAEMLGAIAGYESRHKADRIRAKVKQRALSGRMSAAQRATGWAWVDPCPGAADCRHRTTCEPGSNIRARVGSRAGLTLDPIEAPLVAAAYTAVKEGASLRSAWKAAVAGGLSLSDPGGLRMVLLNCRNAGAVSHGGEIVAEAADGQRIVDRATYDAVVLILRDPSRRTSPGRPAGTPLGGGLLRCARCSGPMAASVKYERPEKPTPVYVCTRHHHQTRRRALIDSPVLDLVGSVLEGLASAGLLSSVKVDDTATAKLRAEVATLENRRDELASLVATGEMAPTDYARAGRKIAAELDGLTAKLTRRAGRPHLSTLAASSHGVAAGYAALRASAAEGDVDALRAVLAEVLVTVTPTLDGGVTLVWRDWIPADPPTRIEPKRPQMPRDERRAKVAELFGQGLTRVAIAERLGISRSTANADVALLTA